MIKKIFTIFFIGLFLLTSVNTSKATEHSFVIDNARIFKTDNLSEIEQKLSNISMNKNINVFMVTAKENLEKDIKVSADNLLKEYLSEKKDGILLLVNPNKNEMSISSLGKGKDILDEQRQKTIIDKLTVNIKNNPNQALTDYAKMIEEYIVAGPQSTKTDDTTKGFNLLYPIIGVFIVASLYYISSKTIKPNKKASKYSSPLSMNTALFFLNGKEDEDDKNNSEK